jgi:choloylglycine hydrolase
MKKILYLSIIFLIIGFADSIPACTGFMAMDGSSLLMGNNEDWLYPDAYIWFHPPAGNVYGRMIITCNYPLPQNPNYFTPFSGMNEMGLCYDVFLHPIKPVINSTYKPNFNGNLMSYCLQTCSTVSEVLAIFDLYNLAFMDDIQYFIVDANGDAAIIEGDEIIQKQGTFQVVTNFLQSDPEHGWYPCWRYNTAVSMLENMTSMTRSYFRDICQATHQVGTYPTIYSNIFDIQKKQVDIYHYFTYDSEVTFNLTEEIAMGTHSYYLPDLFEPVGNHPPEKPSKPSGLPMGRVGVEYTFTSSSSDNDGDIIYYRFDWDDGSISPWVKQLSNGNGRAAHTWDTRDTYEIRVKTKDIYGQESEWSDPFPVQIPKSNGMQYSRILQSRIGWLISFIYEFLILIS